MRPRQIHVLHRPASKKADAPDLVFVHGGYMDSRCWDIHFLPHFSALGHDCRAAARLFQTAQASPHARPGVSSGVG